MAKTKRLFKSFYGLLLPVIILLVIAFAAASVWLVHSTANPTKSAYLVTPEKYGRFSARGAQVTEEKWNNQDGTAARGWLLKGVEFAPAVVLIHRYGTDRSYVLNLGVKINEATNFTILMPDLRGHGENPAVKNTSFGGCEADDISSAIEFIKSLKSENQNPLIGPDIGLYGVEAGALSAISAAAKNENVKAIVLDSVPSSSDAVLAGAVNKRFPFASSVTSKIAAAGTYLYFYDGCYQRDSACSIAKSVMNRQVLLLAGSDAPDFQETTTRLSRCFPGNTKIESKTDLNPSGYGITNASLEQSEAYDRRIIDFFKSTLSN